FIASANHLFGPITTIHCHGCVVKHSPWTTFTLIASDRKCVNNTQLIISDANQIQHYFSYQKLSTLWRVIPAVEELHTAWEEKVKADNYALYKTAIQAGLDKIGKYYCKFDKNSVYILALGKFLFLLSNFLHPYYKLAYIKMAWGVPEEQEQDIAAGNTHTENWYDEALKTVETTMRDYWKGHPGQPAPQAVPTTSTSTCDATKPGIIESEFNRHRRMLVKQSMRDQDAGWATELRRYFKDMPEDVSEAHPTIFYSPYLHFPL
ncbi:hypothetical protein BJ138DRAFT_1020308, partial [Hygrophoropsis aurantiaca]